MVYRRYVESRFYCESSNSSNPPVYDNNNPDYMQGKCVFVENEESICSGAINSSYNSGGFGRDNFDIADTLSNSPYQMTISESMLRIITYNFRTYYNDSVKEQSRNLKQDFRDYTLALIPDLANKGHYFISSKLCDTTTHWHRSDDIECTDGDNGYTGDDDFQNNRLALTVEYSFYRYLTELINCGAFEGSELDDVKYFLGILEGVPKYQTRLG